MFWGPAQSSVLGIWKMWGVPCRQERVSSVTTLSPSCPRFPQPPVSLMSSRPTFHGSRLVLLLKEQVAGTLRQEGQGCQLHQSWHCDQGKQEGPGALLKGAGMGWCEGHRVEPGACSWETPEVKADGGALAGSILWVCWG